MGVLSKFATWLGIKKRRATILVIGLDNAGKSTLLRSLQSETATNLETVPTVGYNMEEFKIGGLVLSAIDCGGASKFRTLWERQGSNAAGILFVVDAADKIRLSVAQDELQRIIESESIPFHIPLLVAANKSDLPAALPPAEISRRLQLDACSGRSYSIAGTSAVTGDGVHGALEWLARQIREQQDTPVGPADHAASTTPGPGDASSGPAAPPAGSASAAAQPTA